MITCGGYESIRQQRFMSFLRMQEKDKRIVRMKTEDTKKKLLLILDMMRKTDEKHPLNATQIAGKLQASGVKAERKSIARDLDCLESVGYEIVKCPNHNLGWYMVGQEFEDHELKMLADAVAAAKFLTIEDSRNLIRKIKNHATREGERLIDVTLIMDPVLKLDDKKFNIKFDTITRAISDGKQLRFQYNELAAGNKKVLKRNGYVYQVSPYFIVLSGEAYYLVGNPATHDHVTFFRIEMITGLGIYNEPARPMKEIVELKDIGKGRTVEDFLRESVNMWEGETATVTLKGPNGCRHDIMYKFGNSAVMHDDGENGFVAHVRVADSNGFYYWLASYGRSIVIEAPDKMRKEFVDYLKESLSNYREDQGGV